MEQIFTVSQINGYLRDKLDTDPFLANIAIKGEISNYKLYPSGHHYFTLKDEEGALKCVMFKGNSFRMRFRPENGMQVIAMGRISVYPRDGAYQLYCTAMVLDGIGDLYTAFEQLKEKLAKEGLFDSQHKKAIPKYPKVIGIITSSAGAAVHDMLRILKKRYPVVKVRLFPVRVQGAEAPPEIAGAIRYANRHQLADLLIVGRGGGSIEDLWAFNSELVARAIYDSQIPIISAVGHEPDVTIADFVADLRAATPSNGAELAVPDQEAILQNLDGVSGNLLTVMRRQIHAASKQLQVLSDAQVLKSPFSYLDMKNRDLMIWKTRLAEIQMRNLERKENDFRNATAKLDAFSPLKVLSRGYAMVETSDGNMVKSIHQVKSDDVLNLSVSDGQILANVLQVEELDNGR